MVLEAGEAQRRAREKCVCVIPCSMVSKLAGNTGRSLNLAAGISGDLLNLTAPDECAAAVTVTITLEDNTGAPLRGFATIRWGTGGHQAQAEVDCSRGTCLSLFASSLRVTVTNSEASATAVAGAFIGAGARPSAAPTRTIEYGSIAAGATSSAVAIPAFARSVSLYRNANAFPARLIVLDGSGNSFIFDIPAFMLPTPILLPAYAVTARVANPNPDSANVFSLVYELAL